MVVSLLVLVIGFLFTTKINAQDAQDAAINQQQQPASTQNGVSPELLKEYQNILNKYKKESDNENVSYTLNFNQNDHDRLKEILFK